MKSPNQKSTISQPIKCLSCQPGYSGSNFGSTTFHLMPGKCSLIENCDMDSSENTMMNACKKCLFWIRLGI